LSDSDEDASQGKKKKKKAKDGDAQLTSKSPAKPAKAPKRNPSTPVPAGCRAVHVVGIASSASQQSQGALRKLFPKATKVIYGAPGKARVTFLESADVAEALLVNGTDLDGSVLTVTPERQEDVVREAEKAGAGHEVFLKWLPPIATEEVCVSVKRDIINSQ